MYGQGKHCGYCKQTVPYDQPHVHDPKVCNTCSRELPAAAFPVHPSSADGRRHSCDACSGQRRTQLADEQRASREKHRREENQLLREHGYRWSRPTSPARLRLLDPTGKPVTKDDALAAIDLAVHGPQDEPFY